MLGLLLIGCARGGSSPARAPAPASVVRIVLVRHAEKQTEPAVDDPPLSAAGQARARALVQAVPDVRAILSTDTLRTTQTATPMAEATGVPIERMEPDDLSKIRATAERLDGGTLLVVGHSNTLPKLLHALTGATIDVAEDDYGDLFIVDLHDPPTLERGRFDP
jgi:broad specificity phosphatase PhoE